MTLDGLTVLSRLSRAPNLEKVLIFQLAGPAAESLAFGTVHEDGCRSDRTNADRVAYELTGDLVAADEVVAQTRPQVRDLLEKNWLHVERVALALLEGSGTLFEHHLNQLLPARRDTVRYP
ncbi:MAG: hypothetical protein WB565_18110 [Acidimicrobiales bacterium]